MKATSAAWIELADRFAAMLPCSYPTHCRTECPQRLEANENADGCCMIELAEARRGLALGEMTFVEMGRRLGVTDSVVKKITNRAMRKFSEGMGET